MKTLRLIPILTLVLLMGCQLNYADGTRVHARLYPNQKPVEVTIINQTDSGSYYVEICSTGKNTIVEQYEIVEAGLEDESTTSRNANGEIKVKVSTKTEIILLGLIPFVLFALACYYPALWFIALPYAIIMGSAFTVTSFVCIFIVFLILSIICWAACFWLTGFNAVFGTIGYLIFLLMFLLKQ